MGVINIPNYSVSIGSLNIVSGALSLNGSAGTAGQELKSRGAGSLPTWTSGIVLNKMEMYTLFGDFLNIAHSANVSIPYLHTNYNTFGTNISYASGAFTNNSGSTMVLLVCSHFLLYNVPSGIALTLWYTLSSNTTYNYSYSDLINGATTATTFGNGLSAVIVLPNGSSITSFVYQNNGTSLQLAEAAITIVQIG